MKKKHEDIQTKCSKNSFLIHFSPVVVTHGRSQEISLEPWDHHRMHWNVLKSSITNDAHFSVDLEIALQITLEMKLYEQFFFLVPFSTSTMLLNRHLTRYKWYFCVILHTHGGMWFVCDKCNWLRGCFLLLRRAIKGYWKSECSWERIFCEQKLGFRDSFWLCRPLICRKVYETTINCFQAIVVRKKQIFNYRSWNI